MADLEGEDALAVGDKEDTRSEFAPLVELEECQACGGMMPSRNGLGVPQYCLECHRPFCGAYWNALGVARSSSYHVCSQNTLKPIWATLFITIISES
ncbi:RING-type E3 ubiquitin transferase [Trifolium repens]|nr:RING-type E3 ubiquitin transferase [Trifolium repens]